MAEAGRAMLYQFGVGLAFLATVRRDGGPRMHPMCPVIVDGGIYAFIEPSPKRWDLVRDGRYAMHCFPPPDKEDAFYFTGQAIPREDEELRSRVTKVFLEERGLLEQTESAHLGLFEFMLGVCLLTRTTWHGDWNPQHTIWRATDNKK